VTPLHVACAVNAADIVEALIRRGVPVEEEDEASRETSYLNQPRSNPQMGAR